MITNTNPIIFTDNREISDLKLNYKIHGLMTAIFLKNDVVNTDYE